MVVHTGEYQKRCMPFAFENICPISLSCKLVSIPLPKIRRNKGEETVGTLYRITEISFVYCSVLKHVD